MEEYIALIKKKLKISNEEYEEIMGAPVHQHQEYAVEDNTFLYKTLKLIHRANAKK